MSALRSLAASAAAYHHSYPHVTDPVSLCSYYRKHNKSATVSFIVITVSLLIGQLFLLISLPLGTEPREFWSRIVLVWLVIDAVFGTCALACYRSYRKVGEECHKRDLVYQAGVRRMMQILFFVQSIVLAGPPLVLTGFGVDHVETTLAMWIVLLSLHFYSCAFSVDGLLYKASMTVLFNASYFGLYFYKETMRLSSLFKIGVPITISLIFVVASDRRAKENFLLKHLLKRQKDMYEEHLEKSQDSLFILSRTALLFANESARSHFATTAEEFWTKTIFVVSEGGESLSEILRRILAKTYSRVQSQENMSSTQYSVQQQQQLNRLRRRERVSAIKTKFYMHDASSDVIVCNKVLNVTVIESEGASNEKIVSVSMHDITEESIQRERCVDDVSKNAFMLSLSQELRTPMHVFQAFLSAAKGLMRTEREVELHRDAKGAWRYLRNKIGDVLDYAQIVGNSFVIHKTRFSLRGFVSRLHKMAFRLLGAEKRRRVRLFFSVGDEVKDDFLGDRDRLEQILFNIISNSAKYTAEGSISLQVSPRHALLPSQSGLLFSVSDTGEGQPAPRLSGSLGETTYSRTRPRTSDNLNHTERLREPDLPSAVALGLTVSKMICARMGAEISVASVPRQGSVFSFILPNGLEDATLDSPAPVPDEGINANRFCHSKELDVRASSRREGFGCSRGMARERVAVLVADDNEMNRSVVRGMVAKLGIHVEEADNGRSTVECLKAMQAAYGGSAGKVLVFMDIDMPIMDGIEATRTIRKMSTITQPYIVALTALASEAERSRCTAAGMNEFISKPLTKEWLLDILQNLLIFP